MFLFKKNYKYRLDSFIIYLSGCWIKCILIVKSEKSLYLLRMILMNYEIKNSNEIIINFYSQLLNYIIFLYYKQLKYSLL